MDYSTHLQPQSQKLCINTFTSCYHRMQRSSISDPTNVDLNWHLRAFSKTLYAADASSGLEELA